MPKEIPAGKRKGKEVSMPIQVTITRELTQEQVSVLRMLMNSEDVYDGDEGQPASVGLLIEVGLVEAIPDSLGTGRRFYILTAKGKKVCQENFKQVTRWE